MTARSTLALNDLILITPNWARLKNRNTPISITVAAKRRKMMQLATKHADIWESSYFSPEEFASMDSEFEKI